MVTTQPSAYSAVSMSVPARMRNGVPRYGRLFLAIRRRRVLDEEGKRVTSPGCGRTT